MKVLLTGRAWGTTHREVELLASLPPELVLIGGLAVMCRVGTPLPEASDRLVATTAGLVAMKASTVGLRASSKPEKRASDLYDMGRLLIDRGIHKGDLDGLPDVARTPLLERIHSYFVDPAGRDRTYRAVRRFGEPHLDLDAAADAIEFLMHS